MRRDNLLGDDLVLSARVFARGAHEGQVRKYTGEPYFAHCEEVAWITSEAEDATPQMVAAAYLHDTVEDTLVTLREITELFGTEVADLVMWLTDISRPEDGNRAFRKGLDRDHTARSPAEAQTVKYADLISNTRSIVAHDPGFAKVYLKEKQAILAVADKGDGELYSRAMKQAQEEE